MRNRLIIVDLESYSEQCHPNFVSSPVGAGQDDASESGEGREIEAKTHLEHDEGDEADLPLEGADPGLVSRESGHEMAEQVEEHRRDQHPLRRLA